MTRTTTGRWTLGEWIVQHRAGALQGVRLRGNGPVASYVSYTAAGVPRLVSGAFQAGTLTVCPQVADTSATVRRIIIGAPGRPRVVPGSSTDCV
jgi:type IV fimbrial biogenesis protein FimT